MRMKVQQKLWTGRSHDDGGFHEREGDGARGGSGGELVEVEQEHDALGQHAEAQQE